jgi:ABC-2 type transport system permease protein
LPRDFAGIGIGWAGFVMLVKRGDSIMSTIGYVVLFLSGVIFPNTVLPGWLQTVAGFVPLTHSLEGMRHALLQGQGLGELAGIVAKLVAFGVVLLGGGILAFGHAVRVAKQTGSLTEH